MYKYRKKVKWNNVGLLIVSVVALFLYINGQANNRHIQDLKMSNRSFAQTNERLADELTSAKEHLRSYETQISALNEELKLYK